MFYGEVMEFDGETVEVGEGYRKRGSFFGVSRKDAMPILCKVIFPEIIVRKTKFTWFPGFYYLKMSFR